MIFKILILLLLILIIIAIGVFSFLKQKAGGAKGVSSLRSMVKAQRAENSKTENESKEQFGASLAVAAAADSDLDKKKIVASSQINLEKKIYYAQWYITPNQFRIIQLVSAIIIFVVFKAFKLDIIAYGMFILTPLFVGETLNRAVSKRFNSFDKDYPTLLMSYVSLLKTGMSALQGLETACQGLDEDSLVKEEVELLTERLKIGMNEEQAIGNFGHSVGHPEIELFVQSLILSKRVGGKLADTLERLAKQVRKRQEFRKKAIAAVGMEKGSLKAVAAIMSFVIVYLGFKSPELIFPAFSHPTGIKIIQAAIMTIIGGFYWSKKVTEIKI